MEISDDKVMDIIMDTNNKVSLAVVKLDDHCRESRVLHSSHDKRLARLEKEAQLEPLEKGVKYYSKKLAPWTAGLSLLAYVIYDLWMTMKGG